MAIYKGDKKIIALYKGDKKIINRYKGTQVLYDYIPEDTGTTTYAEDALVFEFTGTSLTYKLNNGKTTYTATTSPTIVNLSDLGYDANTNNMFYNLFYNQTNLTKVLHFPKITGTNNIGYNVFRSCKNVEYIDLSNIGNLNYLHLQFNGCTSLKNLNLDNVDLSNSNYNKNNSTFKNVPNDIQISMNGCNCESIVTIKQALNDVGIVTYNNNVVTNNNCTIEPYETIEYNVDFYIDEYETYNKELKADSISEIVSNYNEDGVLTLTENDISESVSYEYEQIEEDGEDKIRCTIYYKEKKIYEKTYRGKLPNTNTNACALSCDTDKTIPMQKFYIKWYEDIDRPSMHYITFSTSPEEYGDCYDCSVDGIYICPSENRYMRPDGKEGSISDLPMESGYYVLDMGETVYFKCGEENALFDHVFYCNPVKQSYAIPITCDTDKTIPMQIFSIRLLKDINFMFKVKFSKNKNGYGDCNVCNGNADAYIDVYNNEYKRPNGDYGMISDLSMEGDYYILDMGEPVYFMCSESSYGNIDDINSRHGFTVFSGTESSIISNNTVSYQCIFDDILTESSFQINDDVIIIYKEDCQHMEGDYYMFTYTFDEPITRFRFLGGNVTEIYAIPNATNMEDISYMFEGCVYLKSINLAGINVSNATNASYIFAGLEKMGSEPELVIDVSGWSGPSGMMATNMFIESTNLKTLKLGAVSSGEYSWWLQQIRNAKLENQVKIEYTLIK